MIMVATILEISRNSLRVRDLSNNQEVVVIYNRASRFSVGDRVLIRYRGPVTTKYKKSPHNQKSLNIQDFYVGIFVF